MYIAPEKRKLIIDDLRIFQTQYKNRMSKNTNMPDTTSNNVSGSFTKNRLKFMIILVMQKIDTNQANKYD